MTSPDPGAKSGPASGNAGPGANAARRDALNRGGNPFSDTRFLSALELAGCTGQSSGWEAVPVTVGTAEAAYASAWLKQHSRGEFVFDFVWADASHRAGLHWYPKLLVAAPLTPVTGPRLMADDADGRTKLIGQLESQVHQRQLSSCAVNFCDPHDCRALDQSGWLKRFDWQFHWFNRGYRDFDEFLNSMRSKPRKNIRRERRLAHQDGWRYRWVHGQDIDERELELVSSCYQTTFALYRNLPILNINFFREAARLFGPRFLVCIASHGDTDLACSVFWKSDTHLFGRYWGALEQTSDVHFEACYYQGIEYCIAHGLKVFEPGAQGEHKIRRGFVPVPTFSYHYIRHPGLREGIRSWLELERQALDQYREQLQSLIPYLDQGGEPAGRPGLEPG
ncbi:MAG: GNAT family N-acetyltransferase [Wenzhouxiangellaceae bacterium]|nr:GNAT family N-acetyltransferase [Wenzhouxiangellaceae bacterium]